MDLQTAALLVALASPVIMTAVTLGTYAARLHEIERRVGKLEEARELERDRRQQSLPLG